MTFSEGDSVWLVLSDTWIAMLEEFEDWPPDNATLLAACRRMKAEGTNHVVARVIDGEVDVGDEDETCLVSAPELGLAPISVTGADLKARPA